VLSVIDLTKRYEATVKAVDTLSLDVAPGRVMAILGPNGSGKSTTVKMIAGLIKPTRGLINYRGRDIQKWLVDYKRLVGYVPEEAHLYTYLTAPEYLALVGGLRGLKRGVIEARSERFLTLFGLWLDRYSAMSAWSKGMRQKVLISAALLHDPEIIILDEQNSGLDVSSSLVLRSLIANLSNAGKTIIYCSHVLEEVEKVCSEVCILRRGVVVARDSVDALRSLMQVPSLESVFAELVIDTDVEETARELVAAMHV
jgi:ABC-2 type transport system ATP-binding protein